MNILWRIGNFIFHPNYNMFMQAVGVDIKNFSDRTMYNKLNDSIKTELEQMIEAGFG